MLTKHHLIRFTAAKSLLITLLFVILWGSAAQSQTQFAGWAATFQNYKLTSKTGFYFDIQWRSTDQWQQMHALLIRPGINLYLTPSLTATAGYAFIPQQRISGGVTGYQPEHRTWEQLVFTHPLRKTHVSHTLTTHTVKPTLAHRLRLEQRYLPRHHAEGNRLVRDGHRYAGRLRYFARAITPLGNPDAGWFAAVQNEIFFNIGDNSAVNGKFFDQNRAYVAAGYRCSRQFDMEIGYMNQYINGAGSNSTNNHILQLATYVRL